MTEQYRKTAEEIVRKIALRNQYLTEDLICEIAAAIAAARGRWIPVAERLPTDTDPACLVRNGRTWDKALYDSRSGWMGTRVKGITHWMPVPEWEKEGVENG